LSIYYRLLVCFAFVVAAKMASVSERLVALFRKFDMNDDGRISRAELSRVLKVVNPKFTDQEIHRCLSTMDSSHDGYIDYEEFAAFVGKGNVTKTLNMFDKACSEAAEKEATEHTKLHIGMALGTLYEGEIIQWDLTTGTVMQTIGLLTPHERHLLEHAETEEEWYYAPHLGKLNCMDIDWTGKRFMTGSSDHTLKLWSMEYWKVERTFKGSLSEVLCCSVDWKSCRAVSGGLASQLKIWNLDKSRPVETFQCSDKGGVSCMDTDWENSRVVCGAGKMIEMWDLTARTQPATCNRAVIKPQYTQRFEGHTKEVTCLAVQWVHGLIVSGSMDGTIREWSMHTGEAVRNIDRLGVGILCMTLGKDVVITGNTENTLKVWDYRSGGCIKTLEGHTNRVTSISRVREGFVVSGSMDGTVRVWDLDSGKCLHTIQAGERFGTFVTSIRAEPAEIRDGRMAVEEEIRTLTTYT